MEYVAAVRRATAERSSFPLFALTLSQFSASAGREGGPVQRQQVRATIPALLLLKLMLIMELVLKPVFGVLKCLFPCRTKIDEINQRKEEELKAMNTRIQKLQSDLSASNQVCVCVRACFNYVRNMLSFDIFLNCCFNIII